MSEISFEKLIKLVNEYNADEVEKVTAAYLLAEKAHNGQKRKSGEDYIIHPLSVAYILAEIGADGESLVAALLHDVLEDSDTSEEEIEVRFGSNVLKIVKGLTKISKEEIADKKEREARNSIKLIESIQDDIRILIVKLADRLHNMRTMGFQKPTKQVENSKETLDLFAPLAKLLGAYGIKRELEDLSLMYIDPDEFVHLSKMIETTKNVWEESINETLSKIKNKLDEEGIPCIVKFATKNVYSLYKFMNGSSNNKDVAPLDLITIKVLVDSKVDCYRALCHINSVCPPKDNKIEDFIGKGKPNGYKSIHTNVYLNDNPGTIQLLIRTHNMNERAANGLCAYWREKKGTAREEMQKKLSSINKYKFLIDSLTSLFESNDNICFEKMKEELALNTIKVKLTNGVEIDLPVGASVIDLAYSIDEEYGSILSGYCTINGIVKSVTTPLDDGDTVFLITDFDNQISQDAWKDYVVTSAAIEGVYKNSNRVRKLV